MGSRLRSLFSALLVYTFLALTGCTPFLPEGSQAVGSNIFLFYILYGLRCRRVLSFLSENLESNLSLLTSNVLPNPRSV